MEEDDFPDFPELEIENYVVIVTGLYGKVKVFANVVGIYSTKEEARKIAKRMRYSRGYRDNRKLNSLTVHVRPNYAEN